MPKSVAPSRKSLQRTKYLNRGTAQLTKLFISHVRSIDFMGCLWVVVYMKITPRRLRHFFVQCKITSVALRLRAAMGRGIGFLS
jgi:hypothetical protein